MNTKVKCPEGYPEHIMNTKTIADVCFARGKWEPADWIAVKSLRFDYCHGFVQKDDHIENPCPEG